MIRLQQVSQQKIRKLAYAKDQWEKQLFKNERHELIDLRSDAN